MLIKGAPSATLKQMQKWAESKKATPLFIELANTFYILAEKIGIDPTVVYAQSAKETAYGRFGGVLDASFNNPCGMKTTQGGGNYDKSAHMQFNNWIDGISAQIDHLALYAGLSGYPKIDTTDPRHFPYLLSSAPHVEDLGGKWAANPNYGNDIVKMVQDIQSIKVEQEETKNTLKDLENHWAEEEIEFIVEKGELKGYDDNTFRPDQPLTRAEYCVLRARQLGFVKKKIISSIKPTVFILDPGHRVDTPGKRANGLLEYEFNEDVTRRTGKLLESHGEVYYTIETENHPYSEMTAEGRSKNLNFRTNNANQIYDKAIKKNKKVIFISIHANAASNPTASGYEIFVYKMGGEAHEIAKHIYNAAENILGVGNTIKSRRIKEANFAVLRNTKMPAMLIEHEFFTNVEAVKKLKDDDFRDLCAKHIKDGLVSYMA